MDPRIRTAIWALAGVVLAVGISLTAFAVAGGSIGEPSGPVRVVPTVDERRASPAPEPSDIHDPSEKPEPTKTRAASSATSTSSSAVQSPSSDDHGGESSGAGGGSHDGSDD